AARCGHRFEQLHKHALSLDIISVPRTGASQRTNEMPIMKKLLFSTVAFTGLLAASLQAGQEVYKQVAPPPPVYAYGLGFCVAIDAGANIYQNRGDTRTFTGDNRINDIRDFDATLEVDPKNDVGFFGGVKLGYVFGAGVVRPT